MKRWLILGALAVAVLYFPAAVTAALGLLGTVAVTAAAQPTAWAFAAGLYARPRITRTARRWTP
jgi:hypothetical protein